MSTVCALELRRAPLQQPSRRPPRSIIPPKLLLPPSPSLRPSLWTRQVRIWIAAFPIGNVDVAPFTGGFPDERENSDRQLWMILSWTSKIYIQLWVMYDDVPLTSAQFHWPNRSTAYSVSNGERPSFSFQSSTWTGSCSVAPVALLKGNPWKRSHRFGIPSGFIGFVCFQPTWFAGKSSWI